MTAKALTRLSETFATNERMFPDIMEPWSVLVAEAATNDERVSVMRTALARTIRQRYPLPGEK